MFKKTEKLKEKTKRVFILGNSIIKDLNGNQISCETKNCETYIKGFSCSKTRRMTDYA